MNKSNLPSLVKTCERAKSALKNAQNGEAIRGYVFFYDSCVRRTRQEGEQVWKASGSKVSSFIKIMIKLYTELQKVVDLPPNLKFMVSPFLVLT